MTLKPPPHEATHRTARAIAKVAGLAISTIQKMRKAHGPASHRWRQFKLSTDPAFAEKLHAVGGSTSGLSEILCSAAKLKCEGAGRRSAR